MVREVVIKEQHMGSPETKISNVFTPCSSTNSAGPNNNAACVSNSSATLKLECENGRQTMIASESDLPMIISDSD